MVIDAIKKARQQLIAFVLAIHLKLALRSQSQSMLPYLNYVNNIGLALLKVVLNKLGMI